MKHRRVFAVVSALVAVTLLVAACAPATATPPPIKYRIRALFPIPVENFESAPQVIAMRMGYFAEEGVDLKYEGLGTVAGEGSKLVAEGQAEFALVAVPNVLAARAGEIPVRSVFMEREEYIYDFAVRPDSGIKSFADMEGKKLGLGDPAWAVVSTPILIAAGVDPTTVENVIVGVPNRAAALSSGQVDAVLTWIIEEENWQGQGIKFNLLKGSDVVKFPSNMWLTSEKIIKEQPDMVVAFLRPLAKAKLFLVTNPAAAAEMVLEEYPSIKADWPTALASLKAYARPQPQQEANGYGYHDEAAWSAYIDMLAKMEIFPPLPLDQVMTNQFIQAANDFDRKAVIEQARNYKLKPEHQP